MVSGVSFKNPNAQQKNPAKKRWVSVGLAVMFVLLLITAAAFAVGYFMRESAQGNVDQLTSDVAVLEQDIATLVEESSIVVSQLNIVNDHLYEEYATNTILDGLGKTMVPRVVLISMDHNIELGKDGQSTYKVSLTGDVETFDALAGQIQAWKDSEMFYDVSTGSTSRDDEGRLIFSIDMYASVADEGEGPYNDFEEIVSLPTPTTEEVVDSPQQASGNAATENAPAAFDQGLDPINL